MEDADANLGILLGCLYACVRALLAVAPPPLPVLLAP